MYEIKMKYLILHFYVTKRLWTFMLFEKISQTYRTRCAGEWEFHISVDATERFFCCRHYLRILSLTQITLVILMYFSSGIIKINKSFVML